MLKFHPLACVNKTKGERKDVICGSSEHVVCFRVHSADLADISMSASPDTAGLTALPTADF